MRYAVLIIVAAIAAIALWGGRLADMIGKRVPHTVTLVTIDRDYRVIDELTVEADRVYLYGDQEQRPDHRRLGGDRRRLGPGDARSDPTDKPATTLLRGSR